MKMTYDIIAFKPHRGSQPLKVFMYEDSEFVGYLWMSSSDLNENIKANEKDGDEWEIIESHKKEAKKMDSNEDVTEWLILRDGVIWTDRLKNEAECLYEIQDYVDKDSVFSEDDYSYRKMTKEELDKY